MTASNFQMSRPGQSGHEAHVHLNRVGLAYQLNRPGKFSLTGPRYRTIFFMATGPPPTGNLLVGRRPAGPVRACISNGMHQEDSCHAALLQGH